MRHRQAGAFVVQLQYANRIKKPVVLHVVRAHDEALRLLKLSPPKHSGMIHSFSANWSVAKRYLEMGLLISVGTSVLQGSASLNEVIQKIPTDQLLVETDAPDQKPKDEDGTLNSPTNLTRVIEAVAALRDSPPARIATWTAENASRLFAI
jgi:TatD DNase family protein